MKNIKKTKKFMLLALAAFTIASTSAWTNNTNCGLLKFLETNKTAISTIGHCALACSGFIALATKNINSKKCFYAGTFGGTMLGLANFNDALKTVKSFVSSNPINKNMFNNSRKFWLSIEGLAKTFDTVCSLFTGKKVTLLS